MFITSTMLTNNIQVTWTILPLAVQHFVALYVFASNLEETDFLFDRIRSNYMLDFYGSFYLGCASFACSIISGLLIYIDESISRVPKQKADDMFLPDDSYDGGYYYHDGAYYDGEYYNSEEYNDFTKYNYNHYEEFNMTEQPTDNAHNDWSMHRFHSICFQSYFLHFCETDLLLELISVYS